MYKYSTRMQKELKGFCQYAWPGFCDSFATPSRELFQPGFSFFGACLAHMTFQFVYKHTIQILVALLHMPLPQIITQSLQQPNEHLTQSL